MVENKRRDSERHGKTNSTRSEILRVNEIIDKTCQKYGITRKELGTQDKETIILIIEEIHWEMIQDIIHYS